jgi:hypothetical protein
VCGSRRSNSSSLKILLVVCRAGGHATNRRIRKGARSESCWSSAEKRQTQGSKWRRGKKRGVRGDTVASAAACCDRRQRYPFRQGMRMRAAHLQHHQARVHDKEVVVTEQLPCTGRVQAGMRRNANNNCPIHRRGRGRESR